MSIEDSLSAELARDFDIHGDDLSPELQLCVARLDELRRREGRSGFNGAPSVGGSPALRLSAPKRDFPIELGIAVSKEQRRQILELRGKAFARAGWLPHETAAHADEFDRLGTSILIAASAGNRVVGTIRISIGGDEGATQMPCELEFPSQLAEIKRDVDGRLAEFCRIAVDPDITNRSFRATLYGSLVRTALLVSRAAEIDYALAAVHSGIARFYQHMFGFHRLGKSAGYGDIKQPTQLLGLEFGTLVRRSNQRSGFFHVSADDIRQARQVLAASHPGLSA